MEDQIIVAGLIGMIIGSGITVMVVVIMQNIIQKIHRKKKVLHESQYYMIDHDGNKIPIDEDDGET